jgi:hypothetical protein
MMPDARPPNMKPALPRNPALTPDSPHKHPHHRIIPATHLLAKCNSCTSATGWIFSQPSAHYTVAPDNSRSLEQP